MSFVTQLYDVKHDLEMTNTSSKYPMLPLKVKKSVLIKQLVVIKK